MKIHLRASMVFPLLALGICIIGCSKGVPATSTTLFALQQMQDLATVEYVMSKVVKANDNQTWYKWGDRKILITCEATVKAGIDLSELNRENIRRSGKSISIQLPAPKIMRVNLPPDKIRVAFQDIGFFRTNFTIAEQNQLMQQAETQVRRKASTIGILEQAQLNTQTWMNQYLLSLGFEEIELSFDKPVTPVNR